MLNKEELIKYFKQVKNGDINAKNIIAKENINLVYFVVNTYHTYLEKDELISLGNLGLAKAINTYDIDKNISFSTYAIKCIRNEINNKLRRKEVINISLESNNLSDEMNLKELIPSPDSENFILDIEYKEIIKDIYSQIEELKPLDKKILELSLGLNGQKKHTLLEIANILNYKSTSTVLSRLKNSFEKIRNQLIIDGHEINYAKKKSKK